MRLVQAEPASQCEAVAVLTCAIRGLRPDALEGAEAELAVVVEARGVDTGHVLLATFGDERVVCVGGLPAVDHEVAPWRLDVPQQLGPHVATALPEEFGPLAFRPVDALEFGRLAHLVAEDECNHATRI